MYIRSETAKRARKNAVACVYTKQNTSRAFCKAQILQSITSTYRY